MIPLLHRQPFKTIYLLGFFVATVFVQLPYWLVYYSWRSNRPRRSWTLSRTINVQILRKVTQLPLKFGVLGRRDPSLAVPQEELPPNSRFVWIPELEDEDIVGIVAEHAARTGIKSIAIPAYWILKEGAKWSSAYDKAQKDEKMMLHFHGGAFVTGTGHPSHRTAFHAKAILNHSTSLSRVLSVDYRLSSGPPLKRENPFPSAVIDAIAAYKYLVCEVGFLPQNIIVAGESAGGNIALALTRYVNESHFSHLPPPGGLILSSPVTDISFSRAETSSSHFLNAVSDMFDLPPGAHPMVVGKFPIGAYIGEMDPEETKYNRYLSPASKFVIPPNAEEGTKLFSGFPRSYIMGGGAEHLFDDIVALAERMRDDGVDVTTEFPPDAVHCYPAFDWHEPERTESFIMSAAWLDECWTTAAVIE